MAHNGYRQQWQQPPPQQQYQYDHRNDPRTFQRQAPPPQRPPQQRPPPPQNYPSQNNGYHNGYDDYGTQQYPEQGQWQDQQYQDPYQHNQQYNAQYQDPYAQLAQAPQPERTYQYDDRYRNHGQAPTQQINNPGQPSGNKPKDRHRPQPLGEQRKPKARERILTEPESPKTLAWDNPFGVFPPKKKDAKHQKHASLDGAKGNALGADHGVNSHDQRPHTSQGHRKADPSRPSTSQSHRPRSPPPESPRLPPDGNMPLRKPPPGPDLKSQANQPATLTLPARPTPLRSVTQPDPQTREAQFQQYGSVDPYSYDQSNGARSNQSHDQQLRPAVLDHRRPSDQSHDRNQLRKSFDQDAYRGIPLHKVSTNPVQPSHTSVEMPNFDAISPPMNETTFDAPPPAKEQPVYAKKAYQALGQVDTSRSRPPPLEERTKSPLADFAFDLPSGNHGPTRAQQHNLASPVRYDNPPLASPRYDNPPMSSAPTRYDNPPQPAAPMRYDNPPATGPMHYDNPPRSAAPVDEYANHRNYDARPPPQQPGQQPRSTSRQQGPAAQQGQFPPRGASRADEKHRLFERPGQAPNDSGYWQASPEQVPARPQTAGNGQAGPQANHRQGSRDNYAAGYEQGPRQNSYDRDPYADAGNPFSQEQHYGQSYQGQSPPRGVPMANNMTGAPMPTYPGNSAHPPPTRDYGDRPRPEQARPDMPPSVAGFGDRPAPFRPGLANANVGRNSPAPRTQAPPVQQPPMHSTMQPPMQSAPPPQSAKPTSNETTGPPPVTIKELNQLREGFKERPNDHALGLRFAKRLVEAASVLSSEHGRADPKQTAKNRERYIFDATKVVKKMVSNNSPDAMFYLADCYGQGLLGLAVDPKEAFLLYQSAAKLNHPQSAYRVAVCCELGSDEGGGTRRDPLKAMQWYKRAAALGDTPAMYKMGMIQLKGLLTQPRNPREAVSWLKRAAERADKDNPHALHELGLLYESASPADHILRDERYAFQLFTQAADLGYKYSQFRLGSCYEYGLLGCAIDPRQSIAWYTRAAAQGEHQSELALSGWYLTGAGELLAQSDQEAYLWARKAAMSGLAKAEFAMGYFAETGIGTGIDGEEARRWYYRAAAQSMTKARERLEELKRGAKMQTKTRVSRSHVEKGRGKDDCIVM